MKTFKQFIKESQNSIEADHVEYSEMNMPIKPNQTFPFFRIKSKESLSKDEKKQYKTEIEPHGKYMWHMSDAEKSLPDKLRQNGHEVETGEHYFKNPLYVYHGRKIGEWKDRLSNHFGKTGSELSDAIRNAGHDGIVTIRHDDGTPRPHEIISLK
jgi:hypothetical protein